MSQLWISLYDKYYYFMRTDFMLLNYFLAYLFLFIRNFLKHYYWGSSIIDEWHSEYILKKLISHGSSKIFWKYLDYLISTTATNLNGDQSTMPDIL